MSKKSLNSVLGRPVESKFSTAPRPTPLRVPCRTLKIVTFFVPASTQKSASKNREKRGPRPNCPGYKAKKKKEFLFFFHPRLTKQKKQQRIFEKNKLLLGRPVESKFSIARPPTPLRVPCRTLKIVEKEPKFRLRPASRE